MPKLPPATAKFLQKSRRQWLIWSAWLYSMGLWSCPKVCGFGREPRAPPEPAVRAQRSPNQALHGSARQEDERQWTKAKKMCEVWMGIRRSLFCMRKPTPPPREALQTSSLEAVKTRVKLWAPETDRGVDLPKSLLAWIFLSYYGKTQCYQGRCRRVCICTGKYPVDELMHLLIWQCCGNSWGDGFSSHLTLGHFRGESQI